MKNTFKIGLLTLSLMSGMSYAQQATPEDFDFYLDRLKTELNDFNANIEKVNNDIDGQQNRKETLVSTLVDKRKVIQRDVDFVKDSINKSTENIDNLEKDVTTNKSMMKLNDKRMDAIANHQSNASDLSSSIKHNKEIGMGLKKQFDDFVDDFDAHKQITDGAIAGAAAMTMLTVPKGIGNTALSVAGSYYNGQSGVALGVTHRLNSVTLRAGATYNTGSKEPSVNATIGYDF